MDSLLRTWIIEGVNMRAREVQGQDPTRSRRRIAIQHGIHATVPASTRSNLSSCRDCPRSPGGESNFPDRTPRAGAISDARRVPPSRPLRWVLTLPATTGPGFPCDANRPGSVPFLGLSRAVGG